MTDLSSIVIEFLGGNAGGYLLGRGFVKLTKLLLTVVSIIAALFTAALATLASRGYVTVEWAKIVSDLQSWLTEITSNIISEIPQSLSALESSVGAMLPLGGGALTGFALALKTA